jgi:hypothetical protein
VAAQVLNIKYPVMHASKLNRCAACTNTVPAGQQRFLAVLTVKNTKQPYRLPTVGLSFKLRTDRYARQPVSSCSRWDTPNSSSAVAQHTHLGVVEVLHVGAFSPHKGIAI